MGTLRNELRRPNAWYWSPRGPHLREHREGTTTMRHHLEPAIKEAYSRTSLPLRPVMKPHSTLSSIRWAIFIVIQGTARRLLRSYLFGLPRVVWKALKSASASALKSICRRISPVSQARSGHSVVYSKIKPCHYPLGLTFVGIATRGYHH